MKNKSVVVGSILSVSIIFLFTACSTMLPYRDNFKCERGKDAGVCNSVMEVYDLSNDMDTLRIKSSSDKNNTKEKEKITPTEIFSKQKNDKRLQEIVNAISIKQLQNNRPIIFNISEDSLVDYSYETPNNQQVLEYLIKDNNAYTKRLKDESLNKASDDDSLRTLQDTSNIP